VALGGHALERGDLAEAERHARAAIAAVDAEEHGAIGNPLAWQLLGESLMRQRRWGEAREALDHAVALAPNEDVPLIMRSYVCEQIDDTATSERDARTVAGRSPHLAAGFVRLGEILSWDPRRPEEARAMLQRGIDLGGSPNPDALKRAGMLDPPPK
jgi:tetratricopeptide (TPR) repeat protein